MKLIIEVSQDELRLPLRVCDSFKEMSKETGVPLRKIYSACDQAQRLGINTRFERVFIEEEE